VGFALVQLLAAIGMIGILAVLLLAVSALRAMIQEKMSAFASRRHFRLWK
jgi:type II secretory pathway pseudopilin PulG